MPSTSSWTATGCSRCGCVTCTRPWTWSSPPPPSSTSSASPCTGAPRPRLFREMLASNFDVFSTSYFNRLERNGKRSHNHHVIVQWRDSFSSLSSSQLGKYPEMSFRIYTNNTTQKHQICFFPAEGLDKSNTPLWRKVFLPRSRDEIKANLVFSSRRNWSSAFQIFNEKICFSCTVCCRNIVYLIFLMFLDGVRSLPSQNLIGNTSGEEDINKPDQNGSMIRWSFVSNWTFPISTI